MVGALPALCVFKQLHLVFCWLQPPSKRHPVLSALNTGPLMILSWSTPLKFDQWPFQEPKLEVPTTYKAYVRAMWGDIPPKYGLIWYSTSILGSWNSHWFGMKPKAEKARRMEAIGPKLYNKSVHVSAIRPEDQKPSCLLFDDCWFHRFPHKPGPF